MCDRFLGGKGKDRSLSHISAVAMQTAGMGPVHRYIEELFGSLVPTDAHKLIRDFRWKAIVTTNYDFLVETAYQGAPSHQTLRRLIWDRDDFPAALRSGDVVPYLKVHGCLSRINDPELPLILSSHDYHKFRKNRTSIFSTLKEMAINHPIIFCGYSIADENIRDLIFDVSEPTLLRPKYLLVDPSLEAHDIDYWTGNRFECFPLTFGEFMSFLKTEVHPQKIELSTLYNPEGTSISRLIPSNTGISATLGKYLETAVTHIQPNLSAESVRPMDFYHGRSIGMAPILQNLDVQRDIIDTLQLDVVLDAAKNSSHHSFLYVVKGYAGSGKSVTLKRFAWDSAVNFEVPVFFVNPGAHLDADQILELRRIIEDRIYIFIDNCLEYRDEIETLMDRAKQSGLSITICGTARTNEWNVSGASLEKRISSTYDLLDLKIKEIRGLLSKLEENGCLGYLGTLPPGERIEYLKDKLRSQLLVALHEATEGKSFEEIVVDEYNHITPPEAQLLYLDICTLDRFDVGVRAGLLSRVSGVGFGDFSEKLMAPLEHVISVYFDHRIGDYIYKSRHHHIAEIVFQKSMAHAAHRAAQIRRIVGQLNLGFSSDEYAMTRLVKGRSLAEEFIDKALVSEIYDEALSAGIDDAVIYHQKAVFELHHPKGDMSAALGYITKAEGAPGSIAAKTLAHTRANILRRLATNASSTLEKSKLRQSALAILDRAINKPRDALPFHTKGQILLEQLKELSDGLPTDPLNGDLQLRAVDEMVRKIEANFRGGLDSFPGDERLLTLEAEFSTYLENTPRALRALESAYRSNPDSVHTGIRLARHHFKRSETQQSALAILQKLVSSQPNSKEAHFEMAKMLQQIDEYSNEENIGYHLKRSFSPGDTHYNARWAYARHQYLHGSLTIAKAEFRQLSQLNLPPSVINQSRGEIRDRNGSLVRYEGTIKSIHESFAFITCPRFVDNIFLHFKSMEVPVAWSEILVGTVIKFSVGFNFKGIVATRASLA